MTPSVVLLILALVLFLLASAGLPPVAPNRPNLGWLGLAFLTIALWLMRT